MNRILTACILVALAAPAMAKPAAIQAPPGAYTLDKAHASLTFRVSHMGFSHYTARFGQFDAKLQFDPAKPATSRVEATIDPRSLQLNAPPTGFLDELLGTQWLDAAKFPAITFHSTKVVVTGHNRARITGDFTLHGITHPVSLDTIFNGGYPGFSLDPHARIGFSAHGTFKRSQFGMGFGVPPPGSNMGVGDDVEVLIEAEFNGPDWHAPK